MRVAVNCRHDAALFLWAFVLTVSAAWSSAVRADETTEIAVWWNAAVGQALDRAGENRAELEQALRQVDDHHRVGMAFLVEHMPEADLRSLKADFLLENVKLAYEARERFPWGKQVPEDIFLNDVLPYANINERRDRWRLEFLELCAPLVADCKTAGEAAQRLNERLYGKINVRYSTQRRRADQGPKESMETGLASCTGLSILLADACRAVGVPARIVGIPSWVNKRGNHTWIEVWDQGWHFTGACEPSNEGLNHAWFEHDASLAIAEDRMHSIYAASYRKTDQKFPMVWARDQNDVHAENVTHRYASPDKAAQRADATRLLVRVFDAQGKRKAVAVQVVGVEGTDFTQEGKSRDESVDTNDILVFELPHEASFEVRVGGEGQELKQPYRTTKRVQDQIDIRLD
jgi:hypothetical protein